MENNAAGNQRDNLPKLSSLSSPAKALVTAIILILSIAMAGALGQIIVHDIIPSFFGAEQPDHHTPLSSNQHQMDMGDAGDAPGGRGDLFAGSVVEEQAPKKPFHQTEQFVWLLKWTHIHLFGMGMIFIFMGGIALLLDLKATARAAVIVLPFAGILIDILGLWLRSYVSSRFFWLHVPGGMLFGSLFLFVSVRALVEMWGHRG